MEKWHARVNLMTTAILPVGGGVGCGGGGAGGEASLLFSCN